MREINYVVGDATAPQGDGRKIICHICNNKGRWGAGFVLALSSKWSEPEEAYRSTKVKDLKLGSVTIVPVTDDILVANMVAQDDTVPGPDGRPPVRYGAIRIALAAVNDIAYKIGATLHMPRIGCGLAGGKWEDVEQIIKDVASVDVYVYDLK